MAGNYLTSLLIFFFVCE